MPWGGVEGAGGVGEAGGALSIGLWAHAPCTGRREGVTGLHAWRSLWTAVRGWVPGRRGSQRESPRVRG